MREAEDWFGVKATARGRLMPAHAWMEQWNANQRRPTRRCVACLPMKVRPLTAITGATSVGMRLVAARSSSLKLKEGMNIVEVGTRWVRGDGKGGKEDRPEGGKLVRHASYTHMTAHPLPPLTHRITQQAAQQLSKDAFEGKIVEHGKNARTGHRRYRSA